MTKIEVIEDYVNRGWGVTPVAAPTSVKNSGKNPIQYDWTNNAIKSVSDPSLVKFWGAGNLNVGIVTGEPSRLIVLDIDFPEIFQKFVDKHPEVKQTRIVKRDNVTDGRVHYYFKLPTGMPAPESIAAKTTGWGELQSTGRQVVAPPSIHYTGGVYQTVSDVEPLEFKPEYMPDLLLAVKTANVQIVSGSKSAHNSVCGGKDGIMDIVYAGAEDGTRNNTCFKLCAKLHSADYDKNIAENLVKQYCDNCNPPYDLAEALKTLESAYSKQIVSSYKAPVVSPASVSNMGILNKLNYEQPNQKTDPSPLSADKVVEKMLNLSDNLFFRTYSGLFMTPEVLGKEITCIEDADEYFARLEFHYKGNLDWKKGGNFFSEKKAFSIIKKNVKKYDSIEIAPHYPELSGAFYNHQILPAPDFAKLDKFIDFFNPETPEDKILILSMFLTPFWGGPAGQRPTYVINSKAGRGVGKTTLGEMVGKLTGTPLVSCSTQDDANDIVQRLLSDDAQSARVVFFDNEIVGDGGCISNAGIAKLLTAERISGHKMYVGNCSRDNNFLWIMTLNSPNLSKDFAERCVPIMIKKPEYKVTWKQEINEFVEANRWILISTLLEILKGAPASFTPQFRLPDWLAGVLARISGVDMVKLQEVIMARKKAQNAESVEMELIISEIISCVNRDMGSESVGNFISNKEYGLIARLPRNNPS